MQQNRYLKWIISISRLLPYMKFRKLCFPWPWQSTESEFSTSYQTPAQPQESGQRCEKWILSVEPSVFDDPDSVAVMLTVDSL